MAIRTRCRKSAGKVNRVRRVRVVRLVAIDARVRQSRKLIVEVALVARDREMRSHKRKGRGGVREGRRRPADCRVTRRAIVRKPARRVVRVQRFLIFGLMTLIAVDK